MLVLQVVCAGYQCVRIFPYTALHSVQVESSQPEQVTDTVKILTANVLMGNRESGKLLSLVGKEKPDLILLTEPDSWWIEQFEPLRETYPYQVLHPLKNTYGIALYSRLPLKDSEVKFLVESDIPSIHTVLITKSGRPVKFFGIHPRPPAPAEATETTERDAELITVGKKVRKLTLPTIVAGDLNDVAWSPTTTLFQEISGTLDPRIGRGFFNSFHAEYPFLRFPLDHVFHTSDFRLADLRRLPYIGSDHFPIVIELSLEKNAEDSQAEPEPDKDDREAAEEILEESREAKVEEKIGY